MPYRALPNETEAPPAVSVAQFEPGDRVTMEGIDTIAGRVIWSDPDYTSVELYGGGCLRLQTHRFEAVRWFSRAWWRGLFRLRS